MASRLVAAAASSSNPLGVASSLTAASPAPHLCAPFSFPLSPLSTSRNYGYWREWRPHEKVNIWEDPMSPMMWKTSHFMLASITVWGALVYGGFYLFGVVDQSAEVHAGQTEANVLPGRTKAE